MDSFQTCKMWAITIAVITGTMHNIYQSPHNKGTYKGLTSSLRRKVIYLCHDGGSSILLFPKYRVQGILAAVVMGRSKYPRSISRWDKPTLETELWLEVSLSCF